LCEGVRGMSNSTATPRYIQIATYLRILIQKNQLKRGNQLPTEAELCRRFKCSRSTVRQALEVLVREGEVHRVRGAGTFVTGHAIAASSTLLAAIVPNITNSEIARFVQAVGAAAIERGYTLLLGVTNEVPEIERQFIDEVARLKVMGILKFPTNVELEEETRGRFREYGLPYVIINDFWTDSRRDYHICYDECAAVEMAVDHLVELGHERIVFLDAADWPRSAAVEAFFKRLKSHGLPGGQDHLLLYDIGHRLPPVETLYVESGPRPTGMITSYDLIATWLLVQLRKFEMRVPEDVSVVNINGGPLEAPLATDLTTAVPPNRQMIDQALKALSGEVRQSHVQHHVFRPSFHVGASSGPVAADVASVRLGACAADELEDAQISGKEAL